MPQSTISSPNATTNTTNGSQHTVTVTTKYTRRPDDTGWLMVLLSSSNTVIFLCEHTKVLLTKEKDGRVFFKISDGNSGYAGQEASLKKEYAAKYLVDTPPEGLSAVASVKYNGKPVIVDSPFKGKIKQQRGVLSINGMNVEVTLNSDPAYTPISPGKHKIMSPDRSHANVSTERYSQVAKARCTDVWFPLELEGTTKPSDRYIHIGHISHGCVTVYDLTKWNHVYDHLISRRTPKTSGKYVGEIIASK
jgi:hypothetical protein